MNCQPMRFIALPCLALGFALPALAVNYPGPDVVLSAEHKKYIREVAECARETIKRPRPWLMGNEDDFRRIQKLIKRDEHLSQAFRLMQREVDAILDKPLIGRDVVGIRMTSAYHYEPRVIKLAFCYRMTGDKRYLEKAKAQMLQGVSMPDWHPTHFLDSAAMGIGTAIGYDWLYNDLDEASRSQIRAGLVKLALPTYEHATYWHRIKDNWGQVCNCGQVAVAVALLDAEFERAVTLLGRAVSDVQPSMAVYAPHGAYPEGPGYWCYGTTYNVYMLAMLESALGSDFGLMEMPGVAETPFFMEHATGPSGLTVNFSDSSMNRPSLAALWYFAKRLKNWDFLRIFEEDAFARTCKSGNIYPFLYFWYRPLKKGEATELPLVWYSEGRNPFAVQRSSWKKDAFFAAIKAGAPVYPHGHMDSGSFWLDAGGVRWVYDLGANDYHLAETHIQRLFDGSQGSKRWDIYRLGTLGHNVPMINGEQQWSRGVAKILSVTNGENSASEIVVDMTENYPMTKSFVRSSTILEGGRRYRICDRMRGVSMGSTVTWKFHVKDTEVTVEGEDVILAKGDHRMRVKRKTNGENGEWKIAADPRNSDWEDKNPGVKRISFDMKVVETKENKIAVGFVLEK